VAELDRFMLSVLLGYPERDVEAGMLRGSLAPAKAVQPVKNLAAALQEAFARTEAHPDLVDYIVEVAGATRRHEEVVLGASPRAARQWLEASRGHAAVQGRAFVTPDDVKRMALPVLRHRLVLRPEAELAGLDAERIVQDLLEQVPVPIAPRP
ncbi:MAG TPA: MoxR family ATPase, partial [Candidatus Thermoplasmatota archaeon]|nr:MoxR family ATPase [Candidatus Thermoplasmatota archaeon]